MSNSSCLPSKFYLILLISISAGIMSGCGTLQTKRPEVSTPAHTKSSDSDGKIPYAFDPSDSEQIEIPDQPPQTAADPTPIPPNQFKDIRLGVILGPGGAKTYGHIGVLKELQKRRIPIQMIAGLEWAALPAAIFATKGYVNDVEWQMMKIKEEEWFTQSLLSSKKPATIQDVQGDLKKIFSNWKVENLKHLFVCSAWNMEKKQTYLMQKGGLAQLLPFCLGYPPLFQPYQKNVAGLVDVRSVTDYMRSKGVNYVLFINVLDSAPAMLLSDDLGSSVAWSIVMSQYQKQRNGIDEVIGINLREYQIKDFSKKREIMNKSADLAPKAIAPWAEKLGF